MKGAASSSAKSLSNSAKAFQSGREAGCESVCETSPIFGQGLSNTQRALKSGKDIDCAKESSPHSSRRAPSREASTSTKSRNDRDHSPHIQATATKEGTPKRLDSLASLPAKRSSKASKEGQQPKSPGKKNRGEHAESEIVEYVEPIVFLDSHQNPLHILLNGFHQTNIKVEHEIEQLITANPTFFTSIDSCTRDNALHIICSKIHVFSSSIMCFFIDNSPTNLMSKNKFGMTPLHKAILAAPNFISKRKKLVERENDPLLQRCGINIDSIYMLIEGCPQSLSSRNIENRVPLHLAVAKQHDWTDEIVAALLDDDNRSEVAGAVDVYGYTPLHIAAANKRTTSETIILLLEANPNACSVQDKSGFTPLHWAVSRDEPNSNIVEILLHFLPASASIADFSGRVAADLLLPRPNSPSAKFCVELLNKVRGELRPKKNSGRSSPNFLNTAEDSNMSVT